MDLRTIERANDDDVDRAEFEDFSLVIRGETIFNCRIDLRVACKDDRTRARINEGFG